MRVVGNTPFGFIYSNGLQTRKILEWDFDNRCEKYVHHEVQRKVGFDDYNTLFVGTEQECIDYILSR